MHLQWNGDESTSAAAADQKFSLSSCCLILIPRIIATIFALPLPLHSALWWMFSSAMNSGYFCDIQSSLARDRFVLTKDRVDFILFYQGSGGGGGAPREVDYATA